MNSEKYNISLLKPISHGQLNVTDDSPRELQRCLMDI